MFSLQSAAPAGLHRTLAFTSVTSYARGNNIMDANLSVLTDPNSATLLLNSELDAFALPLTDIVYCTKGLLNQRLINDKIISIYSEIILNCFK